MNSTDTSLKNAPWWKLPLAPLLWLLTILGAPVLTVFLSDVLPREFPESGENLAGWIWTCFCVLYVIYSVIFHNRVKAGIAKLIASREGVPDQKSEKTAKTIATSVLLGATLVQGLLLFDYYGHRSAVEYEEREKAAVDVAVKVGREEVLRAIETAVDRVSSSGTLSPHGNSLKQKRIVEPKSKESSNSSFADKVESGSNSETFNDANVVSPEVGPTFMEASGSRLGTFGDFIGGVLNPLLTFGTLIALAITMLMQRTQLNLAESNSQRNSRLMEKQAFETTFFNMPNLHNTTVQDLKFTPASVEIPVWAQDVREGSEGAPNFDNDGDDYSYYGAPEVLLDAVEDLPDAESREVFARVLQLMDYDHSSTPTAIYHRIQKYHNHVLGHYYRTLYQVLELVEEYEVDSGYEAATRYSSIIRAQLSANEVILLFYNCAYNLVDGGQFRGLIKRYQILEHMPLNFEKDFLALTTPGYNFDIGKHVLQYLDRSKEGEENNMQGGAFGENPAIKEYLAHTHVA